MFKNYKDNVDSINANEFGLIVGNMQTVIEFAGLSLDENDHGQLAKAFQILSKKLTIVDDGDDVSFSLKWDLQSVPFNSSFRDGTTFSFMNKIERNENVNTVIFDDVVSKPVLIPTGTTIPAGKIISIIYDAENDRFFIPKLATVLSPNFTDKLNELNTSLNDLRGEVDELFAVKPSGKDAETVYNDTRNALDVQQINEDIIGGFNPPTQTELNTLNTNLTNIINTLDDHFETNNTYKSDEETRSTEITDIENVERAISKIYLDDYLDVPVKSTDVPADGIVISMDDGSKNNPDITTFKFADGVVKTGSVISVEPIANTIRSDIPQFTCSVETPITIKRFEEVVIDLNGVAVDNVTINGNTITFVLPDYVVIGSTDKVQGFYNDNTFKVNGVEGKGLLPNSYALTIVDEFVHVIMTESLVEQLVNLPLHLLWYKNALANASFITARDNANTLISNNKASLDKLGDLETIVFNDEPNSVTTDLIYVDFGEPSHGNTEFDGENNTHYIMTNSNYGTGECIFDASDYPNMTFIAKADVYKKTILTRRWSNVEVPALLTDITNRLNQVKTDGTTKKDDVSTSIQNLNTVNETIKTFITNTLDIWGNLGMKSLSAPTNGFNIMQFGHDVRTLLSQANEAKSFFKQALDSNNIPDYSGADLITVTLNDDELTGGMIEDYFVMDVVPTSFPFRLKTAAGINSIREIGNRHRVGLYKEGETDYGIDSEGFPERFLLLDDTINLLPFQDADELIVDKNADGDLFIVGKRSSLERDLIDLIETYISEINALSNTITDMTGKTIHTLNGISTDTTETFSYPEFQNDLSKTTAIMDSLTLIDYNEEADLPADTLSILTVKGSLEDMFPDVIKNPFYNLPLNLPEGTIVLLKKTNDGDLTAGYYLDIMGYKITHTTLVDSVGTGTTLGLLRMVFKVMSNVKAIASNQINFQTVLDKIAFYNNVSNFTHDERFGISDAISDDFITAYDNWLTMNNNAVIDIQQLLTDIMNLRSQFVYNVNSTFIPDTIDDGDTDPKTIVENANLECTPIDRYYVPDTYNDYKTIDHYANISLSTLKDKTVNYYTNFTISNYSETYVLDYLRRVWKDAGGGTDTTFGHYLPQSFSPRDGDRLLLKFFPDDDYLQIIYGYIPVDDRITVGNYFRRNVTNQTLILQKDLYSGRYIPSSVGTNPSTNINDGNIEEGTYDDTRDITLYTTNTINNNTIGNILDSVSNRTNKSSALSTTYNVSTGYRVIFSVKPEIKDSDGNITQDSSLFIHGLKRGGITDKEKTFKTGTVLVYDSDWYGDITVKSYSEDAYSKYVDTTTLIPNSDYMADLKLQMENYPYRELVSTGNIRTNNMLSRLVGVESASDIIVHNGKSKHSLMPFSTEMYERSIVDGTIKRQEIPLVIATPTSRPNSVIGYGGVVADSNAYNKGENNTGINDSNTGDYLDGLLPICVRDATDVDSLRAYHRLSFNPVRQMTLVKDAIFAVTNPTYYLDTDSRESSPITFIDLDVSRLIARDINSVTLQVYSPTVLDSFYFTTDMSTSSRNIRYLEFVTTGTTRRYFIDPASAFDNHHTYKYSAGSFTSEDNGPIFNDANMLKDELSGEYQAFIDSANSNELLVYMTSVLPSDTTFTCRIIGNVTLDLDVNAKLNVKSDPLYGDSVNDWSITINSATSGTYVNPIILVHENTFEIIDDDTKNFVLTKNQPYNDVYLFRGGLMAEDNVSRQQLIDMVDPTSLLETNVGLKPTTMAPNNTVTHSRTLVTTTAFYKEYTGNIVPPSANRLDLDYYNGFTTNLKTEGGGFYIVDVSKTIQQIMDDSGVNQVSSEVDPNLTVNAGDLVNFSYTTGSEEENFHITYTQPKNGGAVIASIIELNYNTYIIKTLDEFGETTETTISRDLVFLIKHNTKNNMVVTLANKRVTNITLMTNNRIQTYSI